LLTKDVSLEQMVEEEFKLTSSQEREKYMSIASKANTLVAGGSSGGYSYPDPRGASMLPHFAMHAPAVQPLRHQQAFPQQGMQQFPIPFPQHPVQIPQPPQPAVPVPGNPTNDGMYGNTSVQWVKSSRASVDGGLLPGAIAERLTSKGKQFILPMSYGSEGELVPPQAHAVQPPQQRPVSNCGALDQRRARNSQGRRQVS
jgi:hypothetical protein